jgi:phage regulator Rha-like protein
VGRFPLARRLSREKFAILKSQTVISRWGGARRARPYAFTEQGVAMLSTVLNSERAIQVNIAIMRAFVELRDILATHKDLAHKLEELERKYETHDKQIKSIFDAIRQLMLPPEKTKRQIACPPQIELITCRRGFKVEEPKLKYHYRKKLI